MSTLGKTFDVDYRILLQSSFDELKSLCSLNTYFQDICNDDLFWKDKVEMEFGEVDSSDTYREIYKRIHQADGIEAVKNNRLYVLEHNDLYNKSLLTIAAIYGNIPILNWIHLRGIPVSPSVLRYAIEGGNEEMFYHLVNMGLNPRPHLRTAIIHERLYVLDYILAHHPIAIFEPFLTLAIYECKRESVLWCMNHGLVPQRDDIDLTYDSQHYDMGEFFAEVGYPPNVMSAYFTARNGDLDLLKSLNVLPPVDALPFTIFFGHNETFKWLYENGVRSDGSILMAHYMNPELDDYLTIKGETFASPEDIMTGHGKSVDGYTNRGLELALINRHYATANKLIKEKAKISIECLHVIFYLNIYKAYRLLSQYKRGWSMNEFNLMVMYNFQAAVKENLESATTAATVYACWTGNVEMLKLLNIQPTMVGLGKAARSCHFNVLEEYKGYVSPVDLQIARC